MPEKYCEISISQDGVSAIKARLDNIINTIYPVGSYYWSSSATSPADLWHVGTWERVKDRFVLAAGDTYAAGSTGGEAQHTLTVDEMPSHFHNGLDIDGLYVFGWDSGSANGFDFMHGINYRGYSTEERLRTLPTGGSQPHNNMPPYITAYCWHRIA